MMPDTDSAAHDHDISTLCDDAIFMLDVLCCRSDQDHDYANADGDDADDDAQRPYWMMAEDGEGDSDDAHADDDANANDDDVPKCLVRFLRTFLLRALKR